MSRSVTKLFKTTGFGLYHILHWAEVGLAFGITQTITVKSRGLQLKDSIRSGVYLIYLSILIREILLVIGRPVLPGIRRSSYWQS